MNRIDYDVVALDEVKELFRRAEEFAKEIEGSNSELPIPAVNELRYAGNHVLKAVTAGDKAVFDQEVLKAKGHCQRSMYEASESGIAFALDLIKEFQDDYRDLVVAEIVPDYADMGVRANRARAMLAEGRSNRTSPEGQADRYMNTFRELQGIVDKLQASRNDLNARKLALRREDRRFTTRMVLFVVVPILVAIVTALFTCLRGMGTPE